MIWGRLGILSGVVGRHTIPDGPVMQYGKREINEGKSWSEMDLVDLRNALQHGRSVEEIAEFLCRSEREVTEKIAELKQSESGEDRT